MRVITISTSGDFVRADKILEGIKIRLPAMTRQGMIKWGNILAKDMKSSARQAYIQDFSGILQGSGIRWVQGKRTFVGYLFMRRYGIFLDSMRPHWVSVRSSRTRLLAWSKQARIPNIRTRARMVENKKLKSFGVYVRPHPFIKRGFNRAFPKLKGIMANAVSRGVNA